MSSIDTSKTDPTDDPPTRFGKFSPDVTDIDGESAWRYFDIPKFLDFITRGSLFLTRCNLLGDPYEGAPSAFIYEVMTTQHNKVSEIMRDIPDWERDPDKAVKAVFDELRKSHYVSCWHLSDFESSAMWSIYGKTSGMAVRVKLSSLKAVVAAQTGLFLGKVRYVDYDKVVTSADNDLRESLFMKRRSFDFERELRLIKSFKSASTDVGYYMPVHLDDFIDAIYVSPGFPDWYTKWIEAIMGKFGIKRPLFKSNLDTDPLA